MDTEDALFMQKHCHRNEISAPVTVHYSPDISSHGNHDIKDIRNDEFILPAETLGLHMHLSEKIEDEEVISLPKLDGDNDIHDVRSLHNGVVGNGSCAFAAITNNCDNFGEKCEEPHTTEAHDYFTADENIELVEDFNNSSRQSSRKKKRITADDYEKRKDKKSSNVLMTEGEIETEVYSQNEVESQEPVPGTSQVISEPSSTKDSTNSINDGVMQIDLQSLFQELDIDNLNEYSDQDSEDDGGDIAEPMPAVLPDMGEFQREGKCEICLDDKPVYIRGCCHAAFCGDCVSTYCMILVDNGNIKFPCPHTSCDKPIYQDEVYFRLNKEYKLKLYRFLINANTDPLKKTCPRCSEVLTLTSEVQITGLKVKKRGFKVTCDNCDLNWCFMCQSPWHEGMTCRQNCKGDKLLKKWAKEVNAGQVNARRCPHCKVFIQRKSGCDHMTCCKCYVNFCYRCGERFRSFKFLGDHYSKFGIFGCKYRLMPNRPVLRKFVRGSFFGSKLLIAPVVGALVLVAGAGVLAGAVIASPILLGLVMRKCQKRRRLKRHILEMQEHDRQRIEFLRGLGDPYMEKYCHLQKIGVNNLWKIHEASQQIEAVEVISI